MEEELSFFLLNILVPSSDEEKTSRYADCENHQGDGGNSYAGNLRLREVYGMRR